MDQITQYSAPTLATIAATANHCPITISIEWDTRQKKLASRWFAILMNFYSEFDTTVKHFLFKFQATAKNLISNH